MKTVPQISFHPADYEPDNAVRAWAQLFGWLHRAAPLSVPGRAFTSHVCSHVVGRLVLGQGHFNAQTMTYNASRDQVLGGEQYLIVWTLRRGRMNILHDGQIIDIGAGELWVIDQMRPAQALITDADVQFLVCPHVAIGYDPLVHPARVQVDLTTAPGAAYEEDLHDILSAASDLTLRAAPDRAQAHIDRLRAVFLQAHQHQSSQAQTIRRYVDNQIFDPGLTIEQLMTRFAASRAVILEALGLPVSLDRYVVDRRLDYALRSLGFGPRDARRVEVLSVHLDYASVASFVAAFEARFGFGPALIVGVLAGAESQLRSLEQPSLWDSWHGASVP